MNLSLQEIKTRLAQIRDDVWFFFAMLITRSAEPEEAAQIQNNIDIQESDEVYLSELDDGLDEVRDDYEAHYDDFHSHYFDNNF